MNAKQWLNRGYKLNDEIDALEKAKAQMYERLTSATQNYTPSGGTSSPDPHKFDRLVEYQNEIDNRIDQLFDIKREIQELIANVEDAKLRTILVKRYINFKTMEQIAVDMHYAFRHIERLHKKALNIVDAMLSKMS